MMDWKEEEYVSWKPTNNDAHDSIKGTSFLTKCLIPRPTAWIVVYPANNNEDQQGALVSLVEGYCGASDRPPTLMLGSDSIPTDCNTKWTESKWCMYIISCNSKRKYSCQANVCKEWNMRTC